MIRVSTKKARISSLLGLSFPLIAGYLLHILIGITDTIMVGWYSVEALAAVVLGHTFFISFWALGAGFGSAVMSLVASSVSRNDSLQIRRTVRMGIWLSILFSFFAFGFFWNSSSILSATGQSDKLSILAQNYIRIIGIALFPALLLNTLRSYLAAQDLVGVILWITLFGFFLNIPINYLLIFGNLGMPELGVKGAALSSLLINIAMALGSLVYADYKSQPNKLLSRIWRPDFLMIKKLVRLGLPIGFTNLSEQSLFGASAVMMGWLGTVPLAAHGIAMELLSLAFVIHLGLSSAVTIKAGQAFGLKDFRSLFSWAILGVIFSLSVVVITVVIFVTLPEFLLSVFVDPNDRDYSRIISYGINLLLIAAIFSAVDAGQVMALGLLRGIQDTTIPMILAVFSYFVVGIPLAYILGFILKWGGTGVWLGLAIGLAFAACTLFYRFFCLVRRSK